MSVTDFAIKRAPAVFVMLVAIVVAGVSAYISLPREASPDISIPVIIVSTPYFGVSPADMETLVTQPIEKELKNIGNVKKILSSSAEGISSITIEFEPDTDIDNAMQKVRDKVDQAKSDLPQDAEEPLIQEINFSNFPVMMINISGDYGLQKLKEVGEDLQDKIESVAGVLSVGITGGLEREVKINIDPAKLRYYNLAFKDVIDTIRDENLTIPGGSMELGSFKYLVRVPGEFQSTRVIGNIVLKVKKGHPIYLRDLAEVEYGYKDVTSHARLNGQQCVSLSVTKRSGENLIQMADEIKALIEVEKTIQPPGTYFSITADASEDIRNMVDDLENNIITGLILVLLVLLAFLGFRTSLFVALAIPFSMLISFFVLQTFGFTLNMVVLFSLILALGMLVDNAIVIVENIYRHGEEGMAMGEAASRGTSEVTLPVIIATLTTLCAFFPMIFWPGIMGEFMVYLPKTLIITLTASLFVALIINPVLCTTLLKVKPRAGTIAERDDHRPMLRAYHRLLQGALDRPALTLSISVGTLITAMMLYGIYGKGVQFFPETEPSKIFIDIEAPLGTKLAVTDKITKEVEKEIGSNEDVKQYVASIGVSTGMFDAGGGDGGPANKARLAIDFVDLEERRQSSELTADEIRNRISGMTGAVIRVQKERHGPPTGPPINVELSGDDYDELGRLAASAEKIIKETPGVVDFNSNYKTGKPEIKVRIDREKAGLYGLSTKKVADTIRTAIRGTEASTYREFEEEYDITVRFRKEARSSLQSIREIIIAHEGRQVPLDNIADISFSSGPGSIMRKNLKRVVTLSAQVEGRLKTEALAEVQERLKQLDLPAGYSIEYTGEQEEQASAEAFLKKAFILALLLIAFLLVLEFNSIITASIILFSVVLSLIGVFIGLIITGTPFGIIMTGIGVISLAGVVVNNAIVLLDYIIQLRQRGMSKRDAIIIGGMTRLRPVLLTAVTTILGLIPMATGFYFDFKKLTWITGSESAQWWGPMAVAVIFGLAFATILTLVVVPVLYSVMEGLKERFFSAIR
ncbi:MAG: efflux RND transporter permease subunit [Proteobacteria bacterium]|nr:efflux RND transporter permease subunit [Pseudomonadota bacterium]